MTTPQVFYKTCTHKVYTNKEKTTFKYYTYERKVYVNPERTRGRAHSDKLHAERQFTKTIHSDKPLTLKEIDGKMVEVECEPGKVGKRKKVKAPELPQ